MVKKTAILSFLMLLLLSMASAIAAVESVSIIRQDCTGYSNCYTSLAAWEAAQNRDLVASNEIAVARIEGPWTNPDTTPVVISGWTTGPNNYIKIYTAPEARHSGKWDTGKYILKDAGNSDVLIISGANDVRIDGLQIDKSAGTGRGIWGQSTVGSGNIYLSNNIINGGSRNIIVEGGITNYYIYNNIVYNASSYGIELYGSTSNSYLYNNTVIDATTIGIRRYAGTVIAKNNLVQGAATNYNGVFNTTTNNISEDVTSPDVAYRSKTVTFVDEANKDFHLASTDTSAKDAGIDLSVDANLAFSNDIDGNTRPVGTAWDTGADEESAVSAPPTDTTPPVLSAGAPSGTLAFGTTQTTLSVTTDENSTCKYGTTANTAYASIANTFATTGATTHSQTITGLTNGTSYNYYVRSQDTAGNANTTDYVISFSVMANLDIQPPTIPANLSATVISSSQITLSWTASSDDVGVAGYKVYRNGSQINTTPNTTYSDTGLTPSTLYSYMVSAYDAAGNNSVQSTAVTSTTFLLSTGLKTTHPRLMSQDWINQLTTWSNDSTWGPWTRFKSLADTNFGDNDDVSRLVAKALMWKIGKGDVYLTAALNNFDNVVNGIGSDNAIASKAIYAAYAYDLLYDQLPVASQKNAVDKFVAWQGTAKANPWVISRFVFQNYGIEVWAPAFIAAAAGAYDPANVTNNLDVEYNYWKTNYFNPALYWANQVFHGAMQEGTYYGTVKDTNYFLHAADVVYMAEGIDIFNQNDWFTKRLTWEWQTYNIPSKFTDPIGGTGVYGWYYHVWGHSERLRASVPFQARLNIQLLLSRVTSNPYRGQIYSYLYGNADPDLNKPVYNLSSGGALWAFLYGAKDIASQAVPQSLQFWTTNVNTPYGPGYAFMRTGYTANDIYLSIKCGDMLSRGHDNEEEGTFQLWAKGEDLAIHSGAYDGSGEYSQTSDYFGRTVSANGIIVYDPTEKFHLVGSNRDNDGGQRSYTNWPQEYKSTGSDETSVFNNWLTDSKQPGGTLNPPGVNQKGRLLKADHLDNEYSYVFCDLTRAYNSDQYVEGSVNIPKLSNLTRELALVGNKYLVVMDRLTKKSASHQDKWLLHTQTSFNVNGTETIPSAGEQVYTNTNGAFSTAVNNAKLFGQVVYPDADFQIRKFNGTKKYWNYVKNVPITSNLWYGINWGADRIEIEPTDANLNHNYLVVLYPATISDAMPTVTAIDATTGNMKGLKIDDRVVMFSNNENKVSNVTYVVSGTGTVKQLICDITDNTNYEIRQNGTLINTVSSTTQSTLFFSATLSGSDTFSITQIGMGDTTAPAAVSDLAAATGANPGEINLSWTAPGDDGVTGTASTYIIKYSSLAITSDALFNSATDLTGEPTPLPAGTTQSMTVSGLTAGQLYYFAMKTQDEVPNTSALSNSASALAKPGNNPPVLASIGNKTISENSTLVFTINATDADGDALTYSASNLPLGTTFNAAIATFSWTPDYTQAGSYPLVHFEATDGVLADSEDITITVVNSNTAPVLAAIGDKTVTEGASLSFAISATDADGDALTYSASNLPTGAAFDAVTKTFSWTPDYTQAGSYTVNFSVSDGKGGLSSETITITVTDVTQAVSVMVMVGNSSGYPGNLNREILVSVGDVSGLGVISMDLVLDYNATELTFVSASTAGTIASSWPAPAYNSSTPGKLLIALYGTTPLLGQGDLLKLYFNVNAAASVGTSNLILSKVKINDGMSITSTLQNGTFTVLANQAPILDPVGDKTVNEGELLNIVLTATDADNYPLPLVYSASGLPQGAAFNAATATFSWTPDYTQAGSYPLVHFEATDGVLKASEDITITVVNSNIAPVLAAIGDKTVTEGASLSFAISATDADGDALTYSASNLPTGAAFDAVTKTFSWTPDYTQAGSYNVGLSVSDGKGGSDSKTSAITVTNTNRAPVLDAIGAKTIILGSTLTFSVNAADLDQDVLTYSASNLPQGASFNVATRTFSWTPGSGKAGNYTVTFTVSDSYGASDTETIIITVNLAYGDVNGDTEVSAYDAALAAQHAVGLITLTQEQIKAANVTTDTEVSAYDAALIAQKAVGLISKFPSEG